MFSVLEFLGWVFFFFFEIKGKVRFAAIGKKISNRDKSFAIDRTRTPRKKLLLRLKSRWLETKKDYKITSLRAHLYRMRRKPGKYIREETYMISLPIFSPSLSFYLTCVSPCCLCTLNVTS